MTLEGEQIRDYVEFFCTSDSSSRVLHLVAEPLSKASKQENKQGEEKDGSRGARK
ncbi:MAG: hypothetical protein M3311_06300 [Thermoproteota archaeon]|nr:hypothetical protein [Thermoproteota archaeon]